MIEKETNKNTISGYDKLSIQVSLNGLSFCILDTLGNTIRIADKVVFEKELLPHALIASLQQLFEKHLLDDYSFTDVIVIHRNSLFSLVPKPLFNANDMANYLKYNTKLLATDHIDHDVLENYDLVNVYVPFVNVNNFIYDHFGEFTFKHNGTVMIESLLNGSGHEPTPVCYLYLANNQMEITVIAKKKLLLYNSFVFTCKEDLIYYLLFTMEQLNLDTEFTPLKVFGDIQEGDDNYKICYAYVKNLSFYTSAAVAPLVATHHETLDFTVLNSL